MRYDPFVLRDFGDTETGLLEHPFNIFYSVFDVMYVFAVVMVRRKNAGFKVRTRWNDSAKTAEFQYQVRLGVRCYTAVRGSCGCGGGIIELPTLQSGCTICRIPKERWKLCRVEREPASCGMLTACSPDGISHVG